MANINIGGRLHSTATGNIVTGANEVFDDAKGKKQSTINAELEDAIQNVQGQVQSDWSQTDTTAKDYIKNKPNIPSQVSDVVKYTPQTLSSEQQEQARTNIGAQETLVSGVNIVTINSQSILTGGDITVGDGDPGIGIQDVTTPAQYDGTLIITLTDGSTITVDLNHSHPQYYDKIVGTSVPQGGMLPDVVYKLGTLTGNVTFSLASTITGNTNHYFWTFTTGTPAPVITWPANITWADGYGPALSESKYYEISIMDGIAAYMEV